MSLQSRQSLSPPWPTLPDPLQEPLRRLVECLNSNPAVDALVLFGGLLRGRYHPSSDVNLMLLLGDVSGRALSSLESLLTEARRQFCLSPFILHSRELRRVADVFPVKLLDIQRHHLVLFGSPELESIRVEPEHLRLHLEQGLRNLQLRLRARLAGQASQSDGLRRHLQMLARPLAIHLRELMLLCGLACDSERTLGIYERAAGHWGFPAVPLQQLGGLREQADLNLDFQHLAGQVLEILEEAVNRVDAWQVPS
ncbi:MAG: hypothetical protein U0931_20440 [Vulcanimicrobiota bacterium]